MGPTSSIPTYSMRAPSGPGAVIIANGVAPASARNSASIPTPRACSVSSRPAMSGSQQP
jgi:hypothetical protein